ncbi:DUF551 domain-containing protein [Escherichia coli]
MGAFHIAEQQVDGTSDYIKDGEWPIDNGTIEVYAAPPVPVIQADVAQAIENLKQKLVECNRYNYCADAVKGVEDACRAVSYSQADNQPASGNQAAESNRGNEWTGNPDIDNAIIMLDRIDTLENCDDDRIEAVKAVLRRLAGNSPVTPARLPGGFTIEDAKALHEDLVRSHISQALSGEKMKKNDRDADLRWIHGVIVQAAWFVKASLEQNALSGNYPVTPDGWISCSERMPEDTKMLLAFSQGEIVAAYWNWVVNPIDYKKYRAFTYLSGNILDDVTHWMPLPEPPQEVK